MTLVLTNAMIVTADEVFSGTLHVVDGLIADVARGGTALPAAVDLEGDYLIPGLVELHTDNLERHLAPRPKVSWDPMSALVAHDNEIAGAGITTVLDALGVGEADPESLRGSTWEVMLRCLDDGIAHDALRADHLLHVRAELPAPNTVSLFAPFHEHPRLHLISLMDHTPGQRQWENIEQARVYFIGKKGWSNGKFEAKVEESAELQIRYAEPHRAHFVEYCSAHNISLASHDDTTIAHVEQAHAEGASLSEFPTTVAAADAARRLGLFTVMGGPNVVRGASHSGNVAAGELVRLGLLDILSSDYVPGSLLSGAFILHHAHGITLPHAIAMVSQHPAQAIGLHDRGRIAPSLRADLVQVRPIALSDGTTRPVVRTVWREGRRVT